MTTAVTFLESFDDVEFETALHPEYERGLKAGRAAAEQDQVAQQNQQVDEVAQTLSDIQFTYAEARATVLAQLDHLFDAILTKFLPALEQATLVSELQTLLGEAAKQATPEKPVLTAHPNTAEGLGSLLGRSGYETTPIQTDPTLPPDCICVTATGGHTMIDLSSAVETVRETFEILQQAEHSKIQERTSH